MSTNERSLDEVAAALAAEFPPGVVKFRAGAVSGKRALALAYIDARVVQDRLDDVLGVMGWQDSYDVLPDGAVVCRLSLKIGNEWITKVDVGSQSEQPDEGDRMKAAFSDALKRAAVKFGVARYLYRLPNQWVDYDPVRKQLLGVPGLPGPKPPAAPAPTAAPTPAVTKTEWPAEKMGPAPLTKEQIARKVRRWQQWLEDRPPLSAVNEVLKTNLSQAPRGVKKPAWDLICEYAREMGWIFDHGEVAFVLDPEKESAYE